jgi:prolyl-tRNA synthetase
MKFSSSFIKTKKEISSEIESVNGQLLTKGGFIHQEIAGVYTYMPLGVRVLTKIEDIVRKHMDKVGAEIFMPSLHPKSIWKQSGRLENVDVLFQASGANEISRQRNSTEYILAPTHEDMITPLVKEFVHSYKDLPVAVYQIQTKFRNEARAKSGILRGREFRMKDLYSFHSGINDLMEFYGKVKEIYKDIFNELGLSDAVVALASGGDFTKNYSHEFQVKTEAGEDLIFYYENSVLYYNREVAESKAPDNLTYSRELKPMESIEGAGVIGVEDLVKHLNVNEDQTVKTLIFQTETNEIVIAAVRGDYDINEIKLKKLVECSYLNLATAETVKKVTGAEIGYAGIVNLPENVKVFIDDSIENMVNFECGANKTYYHNVNVNWDRDLKHPDKFYDIKLAKAGDLNPETGKVLETFKACEVGNIFPLNTKFSDAFEFTYADEIDSQKPIYMGSYGIGTSRVMGVIVEKFHDDKGIIWPESVAPYKYHLITDNDVTANEKANELYNALGDDCLWDDRTDATLGQKFADADLIGNPFRIVCTKRSLEKGGFEVKRRSSEEIVFCKSIEEIIAL